MKRVWQLVSVALFIFLFFGSTAVEAANIGGFSNRISDSGPGERSNHTLTFRPTVDISAGAHFDVAFPNDFSVSASAANFSARNVELYINGVARPASDTIGPSTDAVTITRGAGGSVRYTLAADASVVAGDMLELRIGNNTSNSVLTNTSFSTTTGTTTSSVDIEPVTNPAALGVHKVALEVVDGSVIANADFIIFLNRKVSVTGDTTEEIPPFRFNGQPTTTASGTLPVFPGTSIFIEISIETDEFAVCRWGRASGTPYATLPNVFTNTGLVVHTGVVPVVANTIDTIYVRCIDDEGNINTDDYLIQYIIADSFTTGEPNDEGEIGGPGAGLGDGGTGSSDTGSGNTDGTGDGDGADAGSTLGGGSSGGSSGGGGGSGGGRGGGSGGGFESSDGPFESGDGRIIISGYAFPGADVTLLVDGQIVDSSRASGDGAYSMTVDGIARGAYTFGVYAEDPSNDISGTYSTSFTVSGARASRLSNINITPTISVSPDPAEPGETLTISGYALPDATVTIETARTGDSNPTELTVLSDSNGRYTTTLTTSGFARDTYQIRAKAEQTDGRFTNFSDFEFYGIGQAADVPLLPDLNRDGSVNLIDFSIMLFWWQTNGGDSDPPADINQDGNVSLTDFSILLFNWTG